MADTKISALPSASSLSGTEPVAIVQAGSTKKTTVQDIANLSGGGSVNSVTAGTNISVTGTSTDPIINSLSDRYKTTSTTSNTIGNGAKTFSVNANLSYIPLQEVLVVFDSSNHMHGSVTSYSGTTLVVDIKNHTGSGTYTSWSINLDGTPVDAITGLGNSNRLAYFTAAQVIDDLDTATYPSLTELSYVKGVTSALQTQINAKENTITAGTTAQYYRGDKSFQTLNKSAVGITLNKITTGDQTTSSNVAANITDMVAAVDASKRYRIVGHLRVGCNNSGGVKIGMTVPSGTTFFVSAIGSASQSVTNSIVNTVLTSSGTLSSAIWCTTNATTGYIKFEGEVNVSTTAGNVQMQFASNTNGQTSTVYQLGSYMEITEL